MDFDYLKYAESVHPAPRRKKQENMDSIKSILLTCVLTIVICIGVLLILAPVVNYGSKSKVPPSNSTSSSYSPSAPRQSQAKQLETIRQNEALKRYGDEEYGDIDRTSRTVYWVPNGKSYHFDWDCLTLARSKTILHGSLADAIADGKDDPCDFCAGG